MEIKCLRVSKETHEKLISLKYDLGFASIEDLLKCLLEKSKDIEKIKW